MLRNARRSRVIPLLTAMWSCALLLTLLWAGSPAKAADDMGVYSFGNGRTGELGLGRVSDVRAPARIPDLDGVTAVAACYQHSLVLLHNGDVYAFGDNGAGQLGLGDKEHRRVPTRIPGIGKAKAIAAGERHSLLVLENGDVYAFGNNSWGQLGLGDTDERHTPTRIAGLSNAKAVAAGLSHSLVLLDNGDVYSFGYSGSGQLGQGKGGGIRHHTPLHLADIADARAISAGSATSMVLLENGDVLTFGLNRYGQLGHEGPGETPTKIEGVGPARAIAAGTGHSLVLLENGDLYSFGQGNYGQLGLGDNAHRARPTRVDALRGVSMIAAGTRHSLAVLENGEVYSFGSGAGGRLGHGDLTNRMAPTSIEALQESNVIGVAAGYSHSLVLVGTREITLYIDGQRLLTDMPPIMLHNTPMVPLRAILVGLDIEVDYTADTPTTRTVIGTKGEFSTRIHLQDDSPVGMVNGKEVPLKVPVTIVDGHFLVPMHFIADTTGLKVVWDGRSRTITITTPTIEPGDIFIEPSDTFVDPAQRR